MLEPFSKDKGFWTTCCTVKTSYLGGSVNCFIAMEIQLLLTLDFEHIKTNDMLLQSMVTYTSFLSTCNMETADGYTFGPTRTSIQRTWADFLIEMEIPNITPDKPCLPNFLCPEFKFLKENLY